MDRVLIENAITLLHDPEDIVEILGRQFAAHGVTKLGHFVNLKKPA